MSTKSVAGYVFPLLAVAVGACAAPSASEPGELANAAEPAARQADVSGAGDDIISEQAAPELARITLAKDHTVVFTDLEGGVLVSELAKPGMASALGTLGLDPQHATARDVFEALAPAGTIPPERVAKLGSLVSRPMGWGRDKVDFGAPVNISGSDGACNNASFTAATYGGMLPNNQAWLDQHPSEEYSQSLYQYQDGILREKVSPRYMSNMKRLGVTQFRAKGCLEVKEGVNLARHGYWNHVQSKWVDLDPEIGLFYRKSGAANYSIAVSAQIPVGQTGALEWAFFGDAGKSYDWWFRVTRALPQDVVDYMRSYY